MAYFLQEQLQLHKGYIPLETLLTFPKFHYWTDLQLLYDSFTSTEGSKRFRILLDPQLVKDAKEEEERQTRERQQEERRSAKLEKERRKRERQREREEQARYQEREAIVFEKIRKDLLEDWNKDIRQDRAKHEEERRQALMKQRPYSVRGLLERKRESWRVAPLLLSAWESVERRIQPAKDDDDDELRELTIDDIYDDDVGIHFEFYVDRYEEYLSHSFDDEDHSWSDDDDDDDDDEVEGEQSFDDDPASEGSAGVDGFGTDGSEGDEAYTVDDGNADPQTRDIANILRNREIKEHDEPPSQNDLRYALVRHKRVSLEHLRE